MREPCKNRVMYAERPRARPGGGSEGPLRRARPRVCDRGACCISCAQGHARDAVQCPQQRAPAPGDVTTVASTDAWLCWLRLVGLTHRQQGLAALRWAQVGGEAHVWQQRPVVL